MNNKIIIANELDELLDLSKQLDNTYMHNKLDSIKKLLIQEWNESDLFMENILKEINYEGKM